MKNFFEYLSTFLIAFSYTFLIRNHVYFGIALLIITTLHSGFQFGLNIHTLAYVFMILVIASGLFGLYAYIRYPRLRTQNRGEATVGDVWELVASMSSECISIAQNLSDEIYSLVEDSDKKTVLGGSFFKQLSGVDKNCSSAIALSKIKELAKNLSGEEAESARKLVTVMARKVELLNRIREDIKYLFRTATQSVGPNIESLSTESDKEEGVRATLSIFLS